MLLFFKPNNCIVFVILSGDFSKYDFFNSLLQFLQRFMCDIRIIMHFDDFIKRKQKTPFLVARIKNCRQTNLFISFRKKVRVQKPKLNYTLENDNTVRIIMSTAVTSRPMFLKQIQFDCFFLFLYLCMNCDFTQIIYFMLQKYSKLNKLLNRYKSIQIIDIFDKTYY